MELAVYSSTPSTPAIIKVAMFLPSLAPPLPILSPLPAYLRRRLQAGGGEESWGTVPRRTRCPGDTSPHGDPASVLDRNIRVSLPTSAVLVTDTDSTSIRIEMAHR